MSSLSASPAQPLDVDGSHQGGANPIGTPEEDHQIPVTCSVKDFDRLLASGALGQHLYEVDPHPLGGLAVLGVVVRMGEIDRLLPEFAHLLAAIGRLHDGADQALARGEGVADQVELVGTGSGKRADYAQSGLPFILHSEASEPVAGWRGETRWISIQRAVSAEWAAWHGHGTLITLPRAEA